MGDDVIYLPACSVQAGPGGLVLLLAGQLLFPPGEVVDPVHCALGIQPPAFFFEQRIVRFQSVLNSHLKATVTAFSAEMVIYLIA